MGIRVLAIDDDEAGCRLVRAILAPEGFDVQFAHDGEAGLEKAVAERPDLVILDLDLPKLSGIEVLQRLQAVDPTLPVIMLTVHSEVQVAVRATKLGAFDYLTKPVNRSQLIVACRRALEMRALRTEVQSLRVKVGGVDLETQMGPSATMRAIIDQVETVAPTGFSVLILGETGTGKEIIAQALHRHSARASKPFIALDCGAIPENLIESELFGHERGAFTGADRRKAGQFNLAEGGTLFLDEVGNLSLPLQVKLMRVLESRQLQAVGANKTTPIDVRFLAATNNDLQERTLQGGFRADLYFRLAQYTVKLPPLRDRAEDVPYLALRFLREVSVELRRPVQEIEAVAMALLQAHPWPGNVRELRNVVRQSVLESKGLVLSRDVIGRFLGKAPATPQAGAAEEDGRSLKETADEAARAAERQAITRTLRRTAGNKSQAARALKTDFKTLHLKMKSMGICARDYAP